MANTDMPSGASRVEPSYAYTKLWADTEVRMKPILENLQPT
jgi:hypothetical protein